MPRRQRIDSPDCWHHVMNRGIARRPIFEDRSAIRYFLSRLAKAHRRGELEVHAYSLLPSHYHLLIRSPAGLLSVGMRRVQNEYSRWFNRLHRRDGPLFRGRFRSVPVSSLRHRRMVVRYIDDNAVSARLISSLEAYPYCSAWHHTRPRGPRWLTRTWIEADALERTNGAEYAQETYSAAFPGTFSPGARELVERRLSSPILGTDPLDDLVGAAPERVRSWMIRKARTADGTRPGVPSASTQAVRQALCEARETRPDWSLVRGRRAHDTWDVIHVALLRDLAGLRWNEIAERTELGEASAKRYLHLHRKLLEDSPEYGLAISALASRCLGE